MSVAMQQRAVARRTAMQQSRRPRSLRAGFTLVEVMVAVSILAIVCALTWGSFHEMFKTKAIIESNAVRYHSVRLSLERISRELTMAYISMNEDPTQQEKRTFFVGKRKTEVDEIRFSMFGHQRLYADADETDTSQVAYYGMPDREKGSGHTNLMRRETRRLAPLKMEQSPGRADIMCDDVVRLQFDYYDGRDKEWREEWSTGSADGQPGRLPQKVRITLTVRDERGNNVPFATEVRLPMQEAVDNSPKPGLYD